VNVELGQQALLDPEPTRVVRGDPKVLSHWGVDPSTQRVSIAVVTPDGQRDVAVRSFGTYKEGERLHHIYRETGEFAGKLVRAWHGLPGFVWVEQPFAFKHPVPPVSYMVQGVIMAALYAATGAVVESCKPPATWKSLAVGNGNANKAAVMEWAHLNGCPSGLQDDCDAWAIAEAARRTVRFA
jgi:Holliday junction resolvasome RuvABC endonuclease subunit